ncbi:MAG: biotin/lipoyl-binding protein [Clostridia bacterium]|nr:biotin/lipoyl-binding protein [Clostridia bacterium]
MKNLIITVNGVSYDVQVEEVSGSSAPRAAAPAAAPAATPAPAAQPAAAPAATPAAKPAGAQGSVKVQAPMPGTILSVKVSVGQQVKKGDTVAVLEAMKMENEIPAPQDGTVSSVDVSNGATVETGATIVTLA